MHIAILTGGISTEREVALRSGDNMRDWVEKAGHTCEVFDLPNELYRFLERHHSAHIAKYFPTRQLTKHTKKHPDFDLVIPMLHGIYGEDGQVTAFLKTLGYRYAYSDFEVHAFSIHKYRVNLFVEQFGIKVPRSLFLKRGTFVEEIPAPLVCYPLIVKPNQGGSSIDTAKVETREELLCAERAIDYDDILIQECIEGREFTVGVYRDNDGYHSLPIIEIVAKDDFFDYKEKYESDGSNEVFLEGEQNLQKILSSESIRIACQLDIKGIARIDWRYDSKDIYFLEVNTIPGFSQASLIPKMWKKSGKGEAEFVAVLAI